MGCRGSQDLQGASTEGLKHGQVLGAALTRSQQAIAQHEKELKADWEEMEKSIKAIKAQAHKKAQGSNTEAVYEAVRQRDAQRLSAALARAFIQAGIGGGGDGSELVQSELRAPAKKLLHDEELLRRRRELFKVMQRERQRERSLRSGGSRVPYAEMEILEELEKLLTAVQDFGEDCPAERALAAAMRGVPLDKAPAYRSTPTNSGWSKPPKSMLDPDGTQEESPKPEKKPEAEPGKAPTSKGSTRSLRLQALGLPPDSNPTPEELRAAYKRAALQWHPDRPHNHERVEEAAAKFRQAKEAYEVLGDDVDGESTSGESGSGATSHTSDDASRGPTKR